MARVQKRNSFIARAACLATLVLLSMPSQSAELYEFYTGARMLAMGGASVATVNDETALLSNPAALGKIRDNFFTVFDPEVHGSTTLVGLSRNRGASDLIDPQGMLTALMSEPGSHLHLKAQLFPSIVMPNFGVGILAKYQYDAEVDATSTNYSLNYINDYAFVLGYNFRIWDGRIKLGFNAKGVNRVQATETLPTTTTGLKWSDIVKEGFGVSSDVGLILTAPWTFLPTLAAVVRDAGNTKYDLNSGAIYKPVNRPDTVEQSVDAGFSITPILGKATRMQITGEYQGVTTASKETDSMKRIHAGIEFNFGDVIFVRAGMNQRYWTGGLELSMTNLQFQLTSYGEEIGTSTTNKEDRRYVGKFAFRF